ncbi:MgtE protein [Aureimonas flava]|uniref:MgtE protein n=1 Tax=Aureimonas flava TaxID=2320271 RepID=A0A3A1WMT1_9HYPH|nr:MotE family protein [Aureimonas flava]RIY01894.1 MgtE protein [Aureimonas flava]
MTPIAFPRARFGLGLALAVLAAGSAFAAEGASEAPPQMPAGPAKLRVIGPDGKEVVPPDVQMTDTERYCANIANPALDARNAMQLAEIKQAEDEISAKIDELETKRAEVEKWLGERRDFIESTSDIVIGIYAGMKPDAAAAQMAALDRPIAASLLTRLKARQASAILAEMPAPIASELAALIVKKTDRASAEAGAKDQTL